MQACWEILLPSQISTPPTHPNHHHVTIVCSLCVLECVWRNAHSGRVGEEVGGNEWVVGVKVIGSIRREGGGSDDKSLRIS